MTDTDPAAWTADQCIEYLAQQEQPCPYLDVYYDGYLHKMPEVVGECQNCGGTGAVARFPMLLGEQCHHILQGIRDNDDSWNWNDPDFQDADYGPDGYSSCNCQGRGWLPRRSDRLEAVLEAIDAMGWYAGIYNRQPKLKDDWEATVGVTQGPMEAEEGDTPLEAAARALVAAAQAQEGA